MSTWWCLQQGHSLSLSCQRHALQQQYREASLAENVTRMDDVHRQLEALLSHAAADALASMREDARLMQQQYCAMPGSELLELCRQHLAQAQRAEGRKRNGPRG